jgi:hypothetical protein
MEARVEAGKRQQAAAGVIATNGEVVDLREVRRTAQ